MSGVLCFPDQAVRVVAADASRAMKDGVRAVGIEVDFDPRPDEMRAHRAFRDLQFQRPERHAIVVADLALLLHAEDFGEINAGDRGEGRAFAGWLDGEARVVLGQIDLADEGVGLFDRRDPGGPQFLD